MRGNFRFLTYGPVSVSVSSKSKELLRLALVRLEPTFKASLRAKCDWKIELTWTETSPCEPNKGSPITLQSQVDGALSDTGRILWNENSVSIINTKTGTIAELDFLNKRCRISGSSNNLPLDARAIIKDVIFPFELAEKSFILIHGSSFELRGTGYLIVGDKGAGKTTTLISALLDAGGNFISNDKTWVSPAGVLHGWPEPVAICNSAVAARKFELSKLKLVSSGKKIIAYDLLGEFFNTKITSHCAVKFVVFPEYLPHQITSIQDEPYERAKSGLLGQLLDPGLLHTTDSRLFSKVTNLEILEKIVKRSKRLSIGHDFCSVFNDFCKTLERVV